MFPYLIHSSEYNGSSCSNFLTDYNTVVTHVPLYRILLMPVLFCMKFDYRCFLCRVWTIMFIAPSAMRAWYCEYQ